MCKSKGFDWWAMKVQVVMTTSQNPTRFCSVSSLWGKSNIGWCHSICESHPAQTVRINEQLSDYNFDSYFLERAGHPDMTTVIHMVLKWIKECELCLHMSLSYMTLRLGKELPDLIKWGLELIQLRPRGGTGVNSPRWKLPCEVFVFWENLTLPKAFLLLSPPELF